MDWWNPLSWFGGNDQEQQQPDYSSIYQSKRSPKIDEYQTLLEDYAKKRLSPDYQAITPSQMSTIYGRVKSTLDPTFNEGIQGQLANIQSQGVEGSVGTSLLNKLRKDYANDLSGRYTDLEINNIGQTLGQQQSGVNILDQLRSSLLGEASGVAGNQYAGDMQSYLTDQNAGNDLLSSIGSLFGNVGTSLLTDYLSPTKKLERNLYGVLGKKWGAN